MERSREGREGGDPGRGPPPAVARRACVIGAGSSGIVAAKVLRERGLPFDAFELGSDVGGLWRYGNDSGRSPAYASLETNTSRSRTGYACFPLPEEGPDYLHHSELLEYFEAFVDHFGLRERISFRTRVIRVAPVEADGSAGGEGGRESLGEPAASAASDPPPARGRWEVTVRDLEAGEEETRRYGAVLVASGHHWAARWPELPGAFRGLEMHSRDYRTPDVLRGRRVLVVGIGNSACDIACEAAGAARRTLLSTRRGAHVLPKELLGRPIDTWITPLTSRLPIGVQRRLLGLLVRLARGPQSRYGVPTPDHGIGEEHPTISRHLLDLARSGTVEVVPDVERLEGDRVRFANGTVATVDVIVYATGYDLSFPFLEPLGPAFSRPPGNRLSLYRHVVPSERPGLYFLGLVKPLGPIPPLAEAQAEWIGDLLEGSAVLPSPGRMREVIRETDRALRERFPRTRRHTLEVDFYPYLRALERERKRGRRSRRRGTPAHPAATHPVWPGGDQGSADAPGSVAPGSEVPGSEGPGSGRTSRGRTEAGPPPVEAGTVRR